MRAKTPGKPSAWAALADRIIVIGPRADELKEKILERIATSPSVKTPDKKGAA